MKVKGEGGGFKPQTLNPKSSTLDHTNSAESRLIPALYSLCSKGVPKPCDLRQAGLTHTAPMQLDSHTLPPCS